jgi:hypothetical protein
LGSAPLSAQTLAELEAELAALRQQVGELEGRKVAARPIAPAQAVTAGSFWGTIKLPGTNTSFKVGGYAKADIHWTGVQGLGDTFSTISIPLSGSAQDASDGTTRLLARQSRFNIQTRTPSDFGEIKTYIEGDFEGGGGSEPCRTRAASVGATPGARSATSRPVRPGPTS